MKILHIFVQLINGTQTPTITLSQRGPENHCNEKLLHIDQSSITGASPSDGLVSYSAHLLEEILTLCRYAVVLFDSPI